MRLRILAILCLAFAIRSSLMVDDVLPLFPIIFVVTIIVITHLMERKDGNHEHTR
jgi:hypothetical protein